MEIDCRYFFRAKCIGDGMWVDGYISKCEEHYVISDDEGFGVYVDPDTIGEYIGLTDKNGVKIFEGDIVKLPNNSIDNYSIDIVHDIGCVVIHNHRDMGLDTDFSIWDGCDLEVIGNVHDNPDLLEVKKMRDILFRGKRLDKKDEWVEGGIVHQTDYYGDSVDRYFIIDGTDTDDNIGPAYRVHPDTVGQYTGLTDKNGKKIFEGDILKIYEGSENDGYKIRKVYSYGGVLCVDYETSEWDFNALAFLDSDNVFTFEVIGNIHDNSELLEVTE